ncbi:MAG: hypothetical protein BWY31_04669 [Lentisphaerae bacterium ADurb.Bin242]|nr:MAG: hypothetical protein BWY31_04669 [Lentisphaerae bacterium ADurb.Bin242]
MDNESAAGSFFTLHTDESAVIFDDSINRGQAEPRASPPLLGGKKWLKNAGSRSLIHSDSRVPHRQFDKSARLDAEACHILNAQLGVFHGNIKISSAGHRLPRVHEKIEQHLIHLTAVHVHMPEVFFRVMADGYFFSGSSEHFRAAGGEFAKVGRPDFVLAATGKAQKLPCQIGAFLDIFFHVLEAFMEGVPLIDMHEHQGNISEDAHQQIVEIVGNAAGQRPDGLQLLRAQKLALHGLFLRNIDEKSPESHRFSFFEDGCNMHHDRKPRFVFFLRQIFVEPGRFSPEDFLEIRLCALPVVRRQNIRERQTFFHVAAGETEPVKRRFVDKGEDSVQIRFKDCFRQQANHVPKPLFALPQGFLRFFSVGDVK